MPKVSFFEERCKGCGLCVTACPKKIVKIDTERVNQSGYNPAILAGDGCIGCALCATMCPDCVIEVRK